MTTVLVVLLAVLLAITAVTALTVLLVMRRLHRPLELVPGVRGPVPLSWRWSLSRSALLQRRLVLALAGVRLAAGGGSSAGAARPPWADLVGQTERLAVDVEARLVVASGQPRPLRRRLVAELEPEVAQVEQVAGRLVSSIGAWNAAEPRPGATELLERLKAVEAALADLTQAGVTQAVVTPREAVEPDQARTEAGALGPGPAPSMPPPPTPSPSRAHEPAHRETGGSRPAAS